MTAVAVNCLPTDPDWKIVSGLAGTWSSTFEKPNPWVRTIFPSFAINRDRPGNVLPVHLRLHIIVDSGGEVLDLCFRKTGEEENEASGL